jgi:hypothetical protein
MYRFNHAASGASLAAVPVHGSARRYRLSMALPEVAAPAREAGIESATPTLEQIVGLMEPLLPEGTGLSSLRWSSTYRVSHRIVPHMLRGGFFSPATRLICTRRLAARA